MLLAICVYLYIFVLDFGAYFFRLLSMASIQKCLYQLICLGGKKTLLAETQGQASDIKRSIEPSLIKGRVGKFEKPAPDTLFVIFHGMLLTSR